MSISFASIYEISMPNMKLAIYRDLAVYVRDELQAAYIFFYINLTLSLFSRTLKAR